MTISIGNAPCSWGVEFSDDPRNPPWETVLKENAEAGYKGIELGPVGYMPEDPAVLSEIMLNSSGGNWSLEKYNPYPGVMPDVPASRNYEGGFMNMLMLKDLGLAMDVATVSKSSTPMGSLARSLYALHAGKGNEHRDFSSIIEQFIKES